eukprot:TRINITY_DN4020_c0_g1_i1.p6 TRINITY_DN4020_c0_g1~~TRINITY_DN4020_c0_g1_i1.p6  ORF type:complete len:57 (-),score=11.68 TRINITY_DN4020_c0_g1_i1:522-692(-)
MFKGYGFDNRLYIKKLTKGYFTQIYKAMKIRRGGAESEERDCPFVEKMKFVENERL